MAEDIIIVENYSGIKDLSIMSRDFEDHIKGKPVELDYVCDSGGDHMILTIGEYEISLIDDREEDREEICLYGFEDDPRDIFINSRSIYDRVSKNIREDKPIEFPKLWED